MRAFGAEGGDKLIPGGIMTFCERRAFGAVGATKLDAPDHFGEADGDADGESVADEDDEVDGWF